jgi:hypothetical protein
MRWPSHVPLIRAVSVVLLSRRTAVVYLFYGLAPSISSRTVPLALPLAPGPVLASGCPSTISGGDHVCGVSLLVRAQPAVQQYQMFATSP